MLINHYVIISCVGFVPPESGGSIFSRLDEVSPPPAPSRAAKQPTQSKTSSDVKSRVTTSKPRVSVNQSKPRTIKLGKEQKK